MSKKFKPFLAHSELTDLIYIIDENDKYEVTEQCISAMKATNRMPRWIPVSERLPEEGVSVLVYAERNAYGDNGKYRKKVIDIGWQVDGHWHIDGCNGVVGIAWMPLPEPYKFEIPEGAESEG